MLYLNGRFRGSNIFSHSKWKVFLIRLHRRISELTSDQSFGIEDRVDRVHGHLVLGGIADKALAVVEGNIARGGAVALVVGDDLDAAGGKEGGMERSATRSKGKMGSITVQRYTLR